MVQQFTLTTSMGSLSTWGSSIQNILSKEELDELNKIGYTGKNSKEEKSNFEDYLNTLGKGEFKVKQTLFDNGSFLEKYEIARSMNSNYDSLLDISNKEDRYKLFLELKNEFE